MKEEGWLLASFYSILVNIFLFFIFLGPHPGHLEVPRLGVELEL